LEAIKFILEQQEEEKKGGVGLIASFSFLLFTFYNEESPQERDRERIRHVEVP